MAQWGNTDVAGNSVLWGVTGFNGAPNTTNRAAFYGNVTPDAWTVGETVGQFGVDTTEMGVGSGAVNLVTITYAGTGYAANTTTAITNGGGSGANVTTVATLGKVTSYVINNGGSSYESNPTITVAAPSLIVFNGNTDVTQNTAIGSFFTVSNANNRFSVGDLITYAGNVTSTPVGLTDSTDYYVSFANTTGLKISTSSGGANLNVSDASGDGNTAGGATFRGKTATMTAVVGGAQNKGVSHAGWVVRTVGSGGRAGRVQYETLVAMGSIATDGSDDTVLPDA
jgi:hypothetical protein